MKEALQNIRQSADALIAQAADAAAVDELRVRFLGKKGELTAILKQMGRLSAEERPVVGALANEVREAITADIARRTKELESAALAARLAAEEIDVTLPGKAPFRAGAGRAEGNFSGHGLRHRFRPRGGAGPLQF